MYAVDRKRARRSIHIFVCGGGGDGSAPVTHGPWMTHSANSSDMSMYLDTLRTYYFSVGQPFHNPEVENPAGVIVVVGASTDEKTNAAADISLYGHLPSTAKATPSGTT